MAKGLKHHICQACESKMKKVYRMSGYDILHCRTCGMGCVHPMPSEDVLKSFYNGFHQHLNSANIKRMLPKAERLFRKLNISSQKGLRFLDAGGGSGLYAKAFEEAGYGKSTYVDLDPKACAFVRSLGIDNVIHCDVNALDQQRVGNFDFIYSRHLIEHLVDPFGFIQKLLTLLSTGGSLVVQCPNGDSLEYLPYYWSNVNERCQKIQAATSLSKHSVYVTWISGAMLHGIDPPRHLWALNRHGLTAWAQRNGYRVEISTATLDDPVFSPAYGPRQKKMERFAEFLGKRFFARLRGGTHLVAHFQKT